ncbi:MAG: polysaccharide biosynthesis protein [Proteobacteria bacterium]|nr:polysaccharide biosynthesis protein [Pseudomonadota bacterium]
MSRTQKLVVLLSTDAVLCIAATWLAFALRVGAWSLDLVPVSYVSGAALLCWLPVSQLVGVYRARVRFSGQRTIISLAQATAIFAIPIAGVVIFAPVDGVPRTLSVLLPVCFFLLLGASRILGRYLLFDIVSQRAFEGKVRRVLIYGAGRAGQALALSIRYEPGMTLLGFVDDDERLRGQRLDAVPIFHPSDLQKKLEQLDITDVLIAIPGLSRSARKRIIGNLEPFAVHVQSLPNVQSLVEGAVSVSDLREVQVADLLGRDPVLPNSLLLSRAISGKTVFVTGAGGSIGSELCRQILHLMPKRLILVESSEHALYLIRRELDGMFLEQDRQAPVIISELATVTDASMIRRIMGRYRPDTVFHAAAYKHVPLVEKNPLIGLSNNVLGTFNTATAAEECGVSRFILISTDKAVRPTNIMGASKRICELVLQALAARGAATVFSMVRFGNVLGSSGSVVPLFQEQIKAGGPVTVTHRDVTRFFMTIPEASQLVIQAGAMAEGGEVYVLDMGTPVKIIELARLMIHLSGLTVRDADNPYGDIEITEVGLRPGEKLYEELLIGENPLSTSHPRIMRAHERFIEWDDLAPKIEALKALLATGNVPATIALIRELVPEYEAPGREFLRADSA